MRGYFVVLVCILYRGKRPSSFIRLMQFEYEDSTLLQSVPKIDSNEQEGFSSRPFLIIYDAEIAILLSPFS